MSPGVTSFDWRQQITILAPGNQGDYRTCSSFAIASAIEANWLIVNRQEAPIHVSPGYIHTCLGHPEMTDIGQIYSRPVDLKYALERVSDKGYARSTPGDYPFPSARCSTTQIFGKIANFSEYVVDSEIAVANVKSYIVDRGPVVTEMYVWDEFFTTNHISVYDPDMGRPDPQMHSICVIGFNQTGWIVKNSLGPNWGDGGFVTIPYNKCGLIGAPPPSGKAQRDVFGIEI